MFSRKAISVSSLAVLLTLAGAGHASAAAYRFTDSLSGVVSDYGSITLEQIVEDTVLVTVELAEGEKFAGTGNHYAFAFNLLNAPTLDDTNVKVLTAGFTFFNDVTNVPFGDFDYGFKSETQGGLGLVDSLTFTVTLSGLTPDWFQVRSDKKNHDGYYFSADIYSATRPPRTIGAFEDPGSFGSAATPVPEPASLLLFGTGLTVVARRFRKNRR